VACSWGKGLLDTQAGAGEGFGVRLLKVRLRAFNLSSPDDDGPYIITPSARLLALAGKKEASNKEERS